MFAPKILCDNASMVSVLKLFWNLCLLRIGPDAVPGQTGFVAAVVLADIALSAFVNATIGNVGTATALGYSVVSLATVATVAWLVLYLKGISGRFPATLSALAGSDFLLTVIPAALAPIEVVQPVVIIAVFQIWLIVVWGFIFRHAFNTTLAFGILTAFGISVLTTVVAGVAIGIPGVEQAGSGS